MCIIILPLNRICIRIKQEISLGNSTMNFLSLLIDDLIIKSIRPFM